MTAFPFQPAVSEHTNLPFKSINEVFCSPNESKFSLLEWAGALASQLVQDFATPTKAI